MVDNADTKAPDTLQALLSLETIEHNLFRGLSRPSMAPQVYGGQVMAQALVAAYKTVDNAMIAHSMHCYFLRGGDMANPIIYEVERTRDGRAFSSRRVIAIQHGRQIFNMSISFQLEEEGYNHQRPTPTGAKPADLPYPDNIFEKHLKKLGIEYPPERNPAWFFDIRIDGPKPKLKPVAQEPKYKIWFKLKEEFTKDRCYQQAALAYASDLRLLGISLLPHAVGFNPNMRMATIDHSIWLHRDFDICEWQLFSMESPNASGARGLSFGHIYTETGTLVATCTQEGLIRPPPKEKIKS